MPKIEEILHSAYSDVRGDETNRSLSRSLTLDHLLQRHIDGIRGQSANGRPNKLTRLKIIEEKIDHVVAGLLKAGDNEEKLRILQLEMMSPEGEDL